MGWGHAPLRPLEIGALTRRADHPGQSEIPHPNCAARSRGSRTRGWCQPVSVYGDRPLRLRASRGTCKTPFQKRTATSSVSVSPRLTKQPIANLSSMPNGPPLERAGIMYTQLLLGTSILSHGLLDGGMRAGVRTPPAILFLTQRIVGCTASLSSHT